MRPMRSPREWHCSRCTQVVITKCRCLATLPHPLLTLAGAGDAEVGGNQVYTIYSDCGEGAEHTSGSSSSTKGAATSRIPMVAFADLPEEELTRLRAANVNDSVIITRHKRDSIKIPGSHAGSKSGSARPSAAGAEHPAAAYYEQQLGLLGVQDELEGGDGEINSSTSGEDMAPTLPGEADLSCNRHPHVQFGPAQLLPQLVAELGGNTADGAAAAAASCSSTDGAGVEGIAVQPRVGVHSRGDDTARVEGREAGLPFSKVPE